MPASDLSGFAGNVTLPTGHGGAAHAFTLRRAMNTKPTHRYGGNRFGRFRGGIITISGNITVFLRKGATATSPGITTPSADGAALTLTLDVGCEVSGTALFPDLQVSHNFEDPAIEGTYSYLMNGDVTETWATT